MNPAVQAITGIRVRAGYSGHLSAQHPGQLLVAVIPPAVAIFSPVLPPARIGPAQQHQGADLRGTRFVAASLRYANLDNANLEDADFTKADLEGVQLDETSQVLAVAPFGTDRILASYGDRTIREWRLQPGAIWESKVITTLDHSVERLHPTPNGHLVASGGSMLSVLDITAEDLELRSRFGIKSRFRSPILGAASALFAEELGGSTTRVVWYDLAAKRVHNYRDINETIICCALLDGKMFATATENAVRVIADSSDGEPRESMFPDRGVSCLDLRADRDGVLVAIGHYDGTVSVTRVTTVGSNDEITRLWTHRLHSSAVTTLLFGDSDQMITASADRTICVIRAVSTQRFAKAQIQRLYLTLRCRNVQFAGVRTEREQDKLRRYSTT